MRRIGCGHSPITNVQASLNTIRCIRAMSRYELPVYVEREFIMESKWTSSASMQVCYTRA